MKCVDEASPQEDGSGGADRSGTDRNGVDKKYRKGETFDFCGVPGRIVHISPHGNFIAVRLTDSLALTIAPSNKHAWKLVRDFPMAFVAYLGYDDTDEQSRIHEAFANKCSAIEFRKAKRTNCRYEAKLGGVSALRILAFAEIGSP